ncbi:hypothetical protein ABZX63_35855, partial [Streptomyces tendae]|uniref:hypothetical protein n=1 Tax=Streptomyces tendae TaxID=1932 RepID=UPI0033A01211
MRARTYGLGRSRLPARVSHACPARGRGGGTGPGPDGAAEPLPLTATTASDRGSSTRAPGRNRP